MGANKEQSGSVNAMDIRASKSVSGKESNVAMNERDKAHM